MAKGTVAPPLELEGTDGRKYSLKESLEAGPLLAAFFKVTCPTCQFAFPFVDRLYRQFKDKGATVWGVSQDNARHSREFARKYDITFPILVDDYPYRVSKAYQLKYTPTLFLIRADGEVELASEGFAKRDFVEIHRWLSRQLGLNLPALFHSTEPIPEYKPG
jgi:peroxiredoxin